MRLRWEFQRLCKKKNPNARDMNTQRGGSGRILEGKQAAGRQLHGCFSSHLSCSQHPPPPPPPPPPFLPHPSRRSMKRCRCQMTQSCQQTQTADSEGKRAAPEDSFCKTAGICAGGGWYEEETEGWGGIKETG